MTDQEQGSRLRRFFLRGLGALLPTILTIVIMIISYRFIRDSIATPINNGIYSFLLDTSAGRSFLQKAGGLEFDIPNKWYRKTPHDEWKSYADEKTGKGDRKLLYDLVSDVIHPFFGFAIGIVLIFLLGFLLATYVGRRVFRRFEELVSNIPIIKFIYPHVKQLVEFFFKEKKMEFSKVVAIEYPRKGLYSIALMTGEGLKQLHTNSGARLVSVFIPSSPMPMTGYTIFVPYEDVISLDIEVDEAFRLVVTGGVIVPERQMVKLADRSGALLPNGRQRRPAAPAKADPAPNGKETQPKRAPRRGKGTKRT